MARMNDILDAPARREGQGRNYAGFWIRFVAYIVDAVVVWVIQILAVFLVFSQGTQNEWTAPILLVCIGIGYFSGMESSSRQATLGKMLFKLKVGDASGNVISFGNAVGRYLAKILSALILFIGFILAAFDPKKQALHDKIADTYVFEY